MLRTRVRKSVLTLCIRFGNDALKIRSKSQTQAFVCPSKIFVRLGRFCCCRVFLSTFSCHFRPRAESATFVLHNDADPHHLWIRITYRLVSSDSRVQCKLYETETNQTIWNSGKQCCNEPVIHISIHFKHFTFVRCMWPWKCKGDVKRSHFQPIARAIGRKWHEKRR